MQTFLWQDDFICVPEMLGMSAEGIHLVGLSSGGQASDQALVASRDD